MSDFGDFTTDDAFDPSGHADPEQMARHLHEERRFLGSKEPRWEELHEQVRAFAIALIVALLEWLHTEGTTA